MKKSNKALTGKLGVAQGETIGIDIGDKASQYCVVDAEGNLTEQGRFATTPESVRKRFGKLERARIALEAGTHANWMARLLKELGHEVHVANPRQLETLTSSKSKSDRNDAEKLARLARADVRLLKEVYIRSLENQLDLVVLQIRDALVRSRTLLVNQARSLAKMEAVRLPSCINESFGKRAKERLPEGLREVLEELLERIDGLSESIGKADRRIEELLQSKYEDARKLREVPGVGPITALSFVLSLESPKRFEGDREVGAYLGMVPKRSQSGERDPKLGITKEGNGMLRRLLVQCAHHILGRQGRDSALRRWGQKLMRRGGAKAVKRAVVAVARKLGVILHRLWRTGESWVAFPEPGR